MNRTGIIELEGMEFFAYHGCLEEERRDGNTFTVDFKGRIDIGKAAASDNLDDTTDYSGIYGIVAEQMQTPSNLLEHVAGSIVRSIEAAFPQFSRFSVRVSKKNPPAGGPVQWSRVTAFGGSRKGGQER